MDFFIRHKIVETSEGTTIILYMAPNLYEFAQELEQNGQDGVDKNLEVEVRSYISRKLHPKVHAKIAKVMFGSLLVASLTLNEQAEPIYAEYIPSNHHSQESNQINILMDGKPISFSQPPIIIKGSTYIPIRAVSEACGASVWWNGSSKTVGINKNNTKISFAVGSKTASVIGKQMSIPPSVQIGGTVMVPLRFVSSALGLKVDWNNATRTVTITSPLETTYTVAQGDTLWGISQKYGISVDDIKQYNNLTSDSLVVGQALKIPGYLNQQLTSVNKTLATPNAKIETQQPETLYQVVSGDTLTSISKKFNIPVETIRQINNLTNDKIFVGQVLRLSNDTLSNIQVDQAGGTTITNTTYTIQKGDNMWDLSVKYGIPMAELLKVNNMTENSPISIGQKITIPVHHIPVHSTVSDKYGEYLDWWKEAQYVYPIGKVAKVTDLQTGKSFKVKRTIGANHADNEPLTASDAAIIKQVWGGTYSWKTRPVIVEVDGRKIAASMSSMPHGVQHVKDDNNFEGHFDIHFKNSTRHKDGLVDYDHQAKIKMAAGIIAQ